MGLLIVSLVLGLFIFYDMKNVSASSWDPENNNTVGLEYNATTYVYHLWNGGIKLCL